MSLDENEYGEAIPLPEYVVPTEHIDVRIGSLRHEAQLYDNYPTFQREKVWTYAMKRSLIDSILRGFPIPELLAHRKERQLRLIDGQQRLSTILEYMADGFATAREGVRLKEDPCLVPVEPNKRYSRLSSHGRDCFDNYTLRISIVKDMEEDQLGALFRRLQNRQTLTLAEKLWTFASTAQVCAAELATNPFWGTMYTGRRARRYPFLASLMLLCMELASGPTNLTAPCLRTIAAGVEDKKITEAILVKIKQRLAEVEHLFYGTNIHSLKEVVPAYQALILLEKYDCDVLKSMQGCLSSWLTQVRQASLQARKTYGQTDLLSKMMYSRYQLLFWEEELPKVRQAEGICIIDRKRAFSKADREEAWQRQGGMCPACRQPLSLADIAHHAFFHAKGGPTTAENCILAHDACHSWFHALPGVEWEMLQVA